MRWERLESKNGEMGPGKRWGHTCNAVKGGELLYVFGGCEENCNQTNKVHVFDTVKRTWSEPVMNGVLPVPRDSHSCTTVGDNLFIFGGTDGKRPLNDLHILDTTSNTWISPYIRDGGPEAREGHGAALIGKRLFIIGGCGKAFESPSEEYYDDVYMLNIEAMLWKRVVTQGVSPGKRESHSCSSWKNKIIVIGGQDTHNYYLSDIHILDTDTLIWEKIMPTGQLLTPRAGHTATTLGRNLFVFGGFTDEQSLYDDVYMLDIVSYVWTKVMLTGEGPSARFSMAGDNLNPQHAGVLAFIGGCNKDLEALDDVYYLNTGLAIEIERDVKRLEKLSLRKQLKLKCQEQHVAPVYDRALIRVETNANLSPPMPVTNHVQPIAGRQNIYLKEYQTPLEKKTFQAKLTKNLPVGYTIETVIDGKPLRGVLFCNILGSHMTNGDNSTRRSGSLGNVNAKPSNEDNSSLENTKGSNHEEADNSEVDGIHKQQSLAPESHREVDATSIVKNPEASDVSLAHEVSVDTTPSIEQTVTAVKDPDSVSSLPKQDDKIPKAEEHSPLMKNPPAQAV